MRRNSGEPSQAELSAKALQLKQIDRFNYSVPEAAYAANVGRSTLYEAIATGELRTIKIGRRRLVPVEALRAWLASKEVAG